MNYQHHYHQLMERAVTRTLLGYQEKHHVIPRCLGGTNARENIVRLTPEEHYVAHQLLVKIHPGNHRLIWAAMNMTGGSKRQQRNNKVYGWLRRRFAEMISKQMKGHGFSAETRLKMSLARTGKKCGPHSAETKAKMSLASKGQPKSAAHRAALAQAKLGKKYGPHSEEWRENQRKGMLAAMPFVDISYRQEQDYRKQQQKQMREVWAKRRAGALPMPDHSG